jgi:hypothetical protein
MEFRFYLFERESSVAVFFSPMSVVLFSHHDNRGNFTVEMLKAS